VQSPEGHEELPGWILKLPQTVLLVIFQVPAEKSRSTVENQEYIFVAQVAQIPRRGLPLMASSSC
jgi:hypothetical protein